MEQNDIDNSVYQNYRAIYELINLAKINNIKNALLKQTEKPSAKDSEIKDMNILFEQFSMEQIYADYKFEVLIENDSELDTETKNKLLNFTKHRTNKKDFYKSKDVISLIQQQFEEIDGNSIKESTEYFMSIINVRELISKHFKIEGKEKERKKQKSNSKNNIVKKIWNNVNRCFSRIEDIKETPIEEYDPSNKIFPKLDYKCLKATLYFNDDLSLIFTEPKLKSKQKEILEFFLNKLSLLYRNKEIGLGKIKPLNIINNIDSSNNVTKDAFKLILNFCQREEKFDFATYKNFFKKILGKGLHNLINPSLEFAFNKDKNTGIELIKEGLKDNNDLIRKYIISKIESLNNKLNLSGEDLLDILSNNTAVSVEAVSCLTLLYKEKNINDKGLIDFIKLPKNELSNAIENIKKKVFKEYRADKEQAEIQYNHVIKLSKRECSKKNTTKIEVMNEDKNEDIEIIEIQEKNYGPSVF